MSLLQEYEQQPLVSLEESIQSLIPIVPDIEQMFQIVEQNLNQFTYYLSPDESASIMLYTLKWKTPQSSFRFILNETLRSDNQQQLPCWSLYLRLFLHALSKLPSTRSHPVYRRLRMDTTREYSKGEIIIWSDFVSCTSSIELPEDDIYDNEPIIIFIIECDCAKDISKHSLDYNKNEIILYPERPFRVISSVDHGSQLKIIQLKEIQENYPRIQMPQITSNTINPIHRLRSMNGQCQPNSKIDLIKKGLTDRDMDTVINHAMINNQCQKLLLSENHITSIGLSIIATGLNKNISLEFLGLSYNNLSDEGVKSLTEILALNNSQLKTLSLHKTGITDKSVEHLADMLEKNTTLTWLHLGRNKISDQGIRRLTDVLTHHNKTLKALELSHNELITDASVDSLVKMIEHNKSLETLWINDCNLSRERKKKLQQIIQPNRRYFVLFV